MCWVKVFLHLLLLIYLTESFQGSDYRCFVFCVDFWKMGYLYFHSPFPDTVVRRSTGSQSQEKVAILPRIFIQPLFCSPVSYLDCPKISSEENMTSFSLFTMSSGILCCCFSPSFFLPFFKKKKNSSQLLAMGWNISRLEWWEKLLIGSQ